MNLSDKKTNILFCTNNDYVIPTCVAITSLFENNKNHDLNIYIFHSGIKEEYINIFSNLADCYNQGIFFYNIPERYFNDAPIFRWSKDMYYRLLISDLLPYNVDKILYIDSDVIINKDIQELYNLPFDGQLLIATEVTEKVMDLQIKSLDLKIKRFFPSGEILFDLKNIRSILNYKTVCDVIERYRDRLTTPDQDVLNIIFNGKIKPLPTIFNNCDITNYHNNNWYRLINHIDKKEKQDTIVFHYSTTKPWNNMFSGSCEDIWFKYLNISPFSFLYKEKYDNIFYKIRRLPIFKILFYFYIKITPYINLILIKILNEKSFNNLKKLYKNKIK